MAFRAGDFTMQFVCMDASGKTEDWRTGDTTKMVAVLAALGIPITTEKVWRDNWGDERVTYLHGPRSVHAHRAALPVAKDLAKLYKTGELHKRDPQHPMLDGLRAIANLQAIRTWQSEAQTHQLAQCADHRCLLVPGAPVGHGISEPSIVRTANIHRAAALCLMGCHLMRIDEPSKGQPAYEFENLPEWLDGESAAQLITDHKSGVMDQTHPFAFAVECTRTWQKLLHHVEEEITLLMFKAKDEPRYAFVREDASDRARQRTDHFITTGE